jgi:large subunit ribosomal protein L21
MWAIVEIATKQYLVKEGETIEVQRLEEQGTIALDKVLVVADEDTVTIGNPYINKAKITATIAGETKGEKVISYKYRRRKKSRWKKGHRQIYTRLTISSIKTA